MLSRAFGRRRRPAILVCPDDCCFCLTLHCFLDISECHICTSSWQPLSGWQATKQLTACCPRRQYAHQTGMAQPTPAPACLPVWAYCGCPMGAATSWPPQSWLAMQLLQRKVLSGARVRIPPSCLGFQMTVALHLAPLSCGKLPLRLSCLQPIV